MPEILEGDYKVGRVLSVSNGLAWVRWIGYNFLGDTCEPIEHIEPRSKLTSFLKGKQVRVYVLTLTRKSRVKGRC